MLELQITIDLTEQLRRILAHAPADVALAAEIGGHAQIIPVGQVYIHQVAIENSGIDLARYQIIEHLFGLHTIRDFQDFNVRITILLEPVERMPESRITIHHNRLAIEVAHPLNRFVVSGDHHLLMNVIQRHRESNRLETLRAYCQVADRNVPFTRNQRRKQFGEVIDHHQFRHQPM